MLASLASLLSCLAIRALLFEILFLEEVFEGSLRSHPLRFFKTEVQGCLLRSSTDYKKRRFSSLKNHVRILLARQK